MGTPPFNRSGTNDRRRLEGDDNMTFKDGCHFGMGMAVDPAALTIEEVEEVHQVAVSHMCPHHGTAMVPSTNGIMFCHMCFPELVNMMGSPRKVF